MSQSVTVVPVGQGDLEGELVAPAGQERVGGVVLVHEWWGVNDNIRAHLGRIAGWGFLALSPNLYRQASTKDPAEAGQRMSHLDWPQALRDLQASVATLQAHPRSNGKVAVMGFCMGGALTLAAAAKLEGLAAVAPFYGLPDVDSTDWSGVTAPIQAHFAKHDAWAKASSAEKLRATLQSEGKSMELFVYDAQHAFANETRPEVYSPEHAALALQRTRDFLQSHLG